MFRFVKLLGACLALFPCVGFGEVNSTLYPPNWAAMEELTPETLKQLTLQDEGLAMAYAAIFVDTFERGDTPPDWQIAARNDLLRRGNSAAQLLLKLFETHPLQQYREEVLRKIEGYPTIDIAPFLEAARTYWKKNKNNTPPRTCYAIARILSRHGSSEDTLILNEMRDHPSKEVGFVVQPDIERMAKRLNGTLKPTEWTGPPPAGYQWPTKPASPPKAPEAQPVPASDEPTSSTPWSVVAVLVIAAIGLLWLLVNNRK